MLIIGHRGAKGENSQNTPTAIQHAIASGADIVEFDVMTTRDDVPVLYHGLRFSAWGRRQLPEKLTFRELQQRRPKIPTLDATLAICREAGISVNIDLKTRRVDPILAVLKKHYRGAAAEQKILISSHLTVVLARVRRRWPRVRLALYNAINPFAWWWRARRLKLFAVGFTRWQRLLIQPLAQHFGLKTYVYTINQPKLIEKYERCGTWAIATDYPKKMIGKLRRIAD